DLGHERRRLLVPDEDVPDRRVPQRVDEADVLLTGYPEDVLDALLLETADEKLSGGVGHVILMVGVASDVPGVERNGRGNADRRCGSVLMSYPVRADPTRSA